MNETTTPQTETHVHAWTEEIEIFGHELVKRMKDLVAEGSVRRPVIRSPENQGLIEIPLTAGVAGGFVVTIVAPVLAAIGALAALLAHVRVEAYRTGTVRPAVPEGVPDEHSNRMEGDGS